DTTPTRPAPLSLHDALPISRRAASQGTLGAGTGVAALALTAATIRRSDSLHRSSSASGRSGCLAAPTRSRWYRSTRHRTYSSSRSEEHTSELQSRENLVCRL